MIPDARYSRRAVEWLARFGRDPCTLFIVFIAGLGTAHILVRTATYGTTVNADSILFMSTALNFLAGEGWRDFTGGPMVGWPPLFPLLLAAFGWVGIDPLEAGRWINATAFGLTILAAGCWLRSHLRSQWLAVTATATLAASLLLSYFASRLLTDSLFALLTLLALIQLAAFLNRRTTAPLWWAAVFTALAAITRYPGVALIGTGVLVVLPLARWRQTLIFGAVSSVPLLAVLAHNWVATGHLSQVTGRTHVPSGQSLSDGLSQAIEVLRTWVVPPNAPDGLAYLLWLTVAAVGLRRRRPDSETAPVDVRLGLVIPFGAFTVVYLVFLVVVVPFTVGQGIDSRYLLPIYVPLLLTAVFLLDRFLSIKAAGWRATGRCGLAALVGLGTLAHIGFSARENLRRTTQAYVTGSGNTSREKEIARWQQSATFLLKFSQGHAQQEKEIARWQQSATLNYIRDNHIGGRVYTNRVMVALLGDWTAAVGGLRTYRKIPRKMKWVPKIKAGGRTTAMGKSRKYRRVLHKIEWDEIEAGMHIVWLDKPYRRAARGYDYLDLRLLPGIEIVAELADGVVFRRTAYEPFDEDRHHAQKQRYIDQLIQQADEHIGRAGWNVYRTGRKLIYRKQPCAPADVQAKFVLHVVPADPADLPAHRQQHDSDNLDFHFNWSSQRKSLGFRLGDQCIALAHLPDYDINRIHIGQWISKDNRTLWEAEFSARQ